MARGVKSNFRTSRIVLVKYMSSVCSLTEDIYKHLKIDKRHPFLASVQCHSNTTISPAMLNPTLTVHIHSNTTISAAIWAPTLPARLLQYPNVNSLASSLGRENFRSRSQRIWFLPQNVMSSSPPSWVWSTLKNFTVKYSKSGVALRGADVVRLLQHLLSEEEAESGVSLRSLLSKLSPPGSDFADDVHHGAARSGAAPVFDHVDTPPVRRVARARRSLFWQLFTVGSQGCLQCS